MSSEVMVLLAVIVISTILFSALNPKRKECKIEFNFGLTGFKLKFETNEKSTPCK